MAKRKTIEDTGGEAAASPQGAPEPAPAKSEINNELPTVESPPISPGTLAAAPTAAAEPAAEPIAVAGSAVEPIAAPAPETESLGTAARAGAPVFARRPRFALRARHKRYAVLAASVAIAAALGAVIGALASGGFATPAPARPDVAGIEERKAMQQSIARLGRELTTLKTSVETATRTAHMQIAKLSERLDRAPSPEITGSIPATPPASASIPTPRPAPRIAAVETRPSGHPPVVQGWAIRGNRDGYIYVEGHGDVYQVVLGAPLPGLGVVESIKRQDGHWVVVTPKGIIVSMRDRRYFD